MFSTKSLGARLASWVSFIVLALFSIAQPAQSSTPLPGDVVINLDHPPAVVHIYDKHDERIIFVKDMRTGSKLVSYTDSLFVKSPLLKKAPTTFLEPGQEIVLLLHPWSRGKGVITIRPDGSNVNVAVPLTVEHHSPGESADYLPPNPRALVMYYQDGETRVNNPLLIELAKENAVVRDVVSDLQNGININRKGEKEAPNPKRKFELVQYEVFPSEKTDIFMHQMKPNYVSADIDPDREAPAEPSSYQKDLIAKVESRDFSSFPPIYGENAKQIPDTDRLAAKTLLAKGFKVYDCEAPFSGMFGATFGHLSFQRKTETGYALVYLTFSEKY